MTHLEGAGDLRQAFAWHLRPGMGSTCRDIAAARVSWQRARRVADRLSAAEPDRPAMRIAARTVLCATFWQSGGSVADAGIDDLRQPATTAAGEKRSLAIGMAGLLPLLTFHVAYRESERLGAECADLIESIGDPTITIGLLYGPMYAKLQAGQVIEALRLAQRVIDLARDHPRRNEPIIRSPLAPATAGRGAARCFLGIAGSQNDVDTAIAMAGVLDATTFVARSPTGQYLPDSSGLRHSAEALHMVERSAADFTVAPDRVTRGLVLVNRDGPEHGLGFKLLAAAREAATNERLTWTTRPIIDTQVAKEKARTEDFHVAIDMSQAVLDDQFETGEMIWRGPAATVLVESLLRRRASGDRRKARAAIERLAAVPMDPGLVLHDIPVLRLRALLARDDGDDAGYREGKGDLVRIRTAHGDRRRHDMSGHRTIPGFQFRRLSGTPPVIGIHFTYRKTTGRTISDEQPGRTRDHATIPGISRGFGATGA